MEQQAQYFTSEVAYEIKFENCDFDHGQRGWFLSIDKDKNNPLKVRTVNTRWIYLLKPCAAIFETNIKWKFIPTGEFNVYKIIVAEGEYKSHQLFCYKDFGGDIRDKISFYVFAAPQGYNETFNRWKVTKAANNLYSIESIENHHFLSAHRYYANNKQDIRNNDSTWVMGHQTKSAMAIWQILKCS